MKPTTFILALGLALSIALPAATADDAVAPTLVEVEPTPEGEAEWVEFANPAPTPVSLEGLYLTDDDFCFAPDGPTESYRWPLNVTVPAQDRLVVELPSSCLTLANSGDTLALEDEDGNVLQSVSYGAEGALPTPTEAQSLSACHAAGLIHGGWDVAAHSPGADNHACLPAAS